MSPRIGLRQRACFPWAAVVGLLVTFLFAVTVRAGGIAFYPPVAVGATPLTETSGIAESRLHPGILWIHDDSGNPGTVYGIDYAGKIQASYYFGSQTDWEDIAVGPGENGASSVFIGDIGDNGFSRAFVNIYRMAEPAALTSDPNPIPSGQYDRAKIQYPNGPHNAEALVVDPVTGDLFVFSKGATTADVSYVYRGGQSIFDDPDAFHLLQQVTTLSILSRITAADISPDGQWLLIRNYGTTAYAYRRLPGQTITDALAGTPTGITLVAQTQAEAIGWAADGSGFFTTSESLGSKIYYHEMAAPGDANLDHAVDGADYTLWADNYLQTGQTWGDGDFNGDQVVDGGDYTIWADNYSPEPGHGAAIPEPASLTLGVLGFAGALAGVACRTRDARHRCASAALSQDLPLDRPSNGRR